MLAFWALYNVYFPHNLLNFLHYFYQYMLNWHKEIFESRAYHDQGASEGFRRNYLVRENRRFFEETTYSHFVIQFGNILLFQLIFLFVFLIVKIIYWLSRTRVHPNKFNAYSVEQKNAVSKSHGFWRKVNDLFDQRFMYSMWMFFIVEVVVYVIYNFKHTTWSYSHPLFRFSMFLAILYFIIYILLTAWNFFVSSRPEATLDSDGFKRRWGFVYEGLERSFIRRIFQFIQYVFYFAFGFFLSVLYASGVAQVTLHLIFLLIFLIYIVIFRPARTLFWKYEQIGVYFFLFVAQILVSTLIYDDDTKTMSGISRWRMGYAVTFFIFFLIVWNMFVLLWKLIEYMLKCRAARLAGPVVATQRIGSLTVDRDYETGGTTYVRNPRGEYELIERTDVKQIRTSD